MQNRDVNHVKLLIEITFLNIATYEYSSTTVRRTHETSKDVDLLHGKVDPLFADVPDAKVKGF